MTDLHLVSWNRPKMTELVIKAIHRNTPKGSFRLVVLDNGSSGDTPEMLQNLEARGMIDELLLFKTNMGLEGARNLLLNNATQSDRFVCVDNDCLPPPTNWLEQLNGLMDKYKDYAAISMRTSPMIGTGNIFEQADENGDDLVDFPHPGGSYRIMNTKLVYQVGGWKRDMMYGPGEEFALGRGTEERLICGKLRNFGYKTAFATNIKSLHLYGPAEKTDRWGYPKEWKPEDTGHSDVWHPKFAQGDDPDEVREYVGEELTKWYL